MTPVPPPAPIPGYPHTHPMNNITPFTYRDGQTFQSLLYSLRNYVINELIPYIEQTIDTQTDYVDTEIAQMIANVNASLAQMQAYVDDQVDAIINDSIDVQDPVVAQIFQNAVSQTRAVTDLLYQAKGVPDDAGVASLFSDDDSDTRGVTDTLYADKSVQTTVETGRLSAAHVDDNIQTVVTPMLDDMEVEYKAADTVVTNAFNARDNVKTSLTNKTGTNLDASTYPYSVFRVHTGGKLIPGLIGKEFANSYENSGTSGTAFIPPRINLSEFASQKGGGAIFNGSGWRLSGNVGEMRGAQIRNGVVYHDLSDTNFQDCSAIGIRKDGSLKCYSTMNGDSAASMVADGVVNSWSWGPCIVKEGVAQPLTDPIWAGAIADGKSGRTILGQSQFGDIIVISVIGVTGASGLAVTEAATLAIAEGCYTALILDGGGSAQSFMNKTYQQPSSDSGGVRPVADIIAFNIEADAIPDSGWFDIALASGYAKNGANLRTRMVGGAIYFEGQVKPSTGTFGSTSVTIGTVHPAHRHNLPVKQYIGIGDASNYRKVTVESNGNIQIVGSSTNTPAYISLDAIEYIRG